jgi:hypothetical protein
MNEILEAAKNQLEEKYNIIQKLYDSRKSELKQPYSDADQELINELHGANGVLRFFYHKLRIIKSQKFKAEVEQRVNNELFEKWVNVAVQERIGFFSPKKNDENIKFSIYKDMAYDPNYC